MRAPGPSPRGQWGQVQMFGQSGEQVYAAYAESEARLLSGACGLLPGYTRHAQQPEALKGGAVLCLGSGAAAWAEVVLEQVQGAHMCVWSAPGRGESTHDDLPHALDAFADAQFDLVVCRLLGRGLRRAGWPCLLAACRRMLRPGGLLYVQEMGFGRAEEHVAPEHQTLMRQLAATVERVQLGIAPLHSFQTWRHDATDCLRLAGFTEIDGAPLLLEYGPHRQIWRHLFLALLRCFWLPLLEQAGDLAPGADAEHLYQDLARETAHSSFRGLLPLLALWGTSTPGDPERDVQERRAP